MLILNGDEYEKYFEPAMMTEFVYSNVFGLYTVAATNGESDYIKWQLHGDEPGDVHFEYQDQSHSGYNVVSECSVDSDGCHIALVSGVLVHFYWNPPRHEHLPDFIDGLRKIYVNNQHVLIIHDYQ